MCVARNFIVRYRGGGKAFGEAKSVVNLLAEQIYFDKHPLSFQVEVPISSLLFNPSRYVEMLKVLRVCYL